MTATIRPGLHDCAECEATGIDFVVIQMGTVSFSLCPKHRKKLRHLIERIDRKIELATTRQTRI